ncbi:MAG: hypothetical protein SPG06_01350 [Eubacteriales bacterium]|nr:hypothetical protein [Eubacteriales bacterium]
MNFIELMATESTEPSIVNFKQVHNEIIVCGQMASSYIFELGRKLKQMRDEKLYKAVGFNTFEEYSTNAIGFSERQAYTYINIVEKNSAEFLKSTSKIGVTKLALLSPLAEDEKKELVESGKAEKLSVKDLKQEIQNLKGKNSELEKQIETAERYKKEIAKLNDELKGNSEKIQALNVELAKAKTETKIETIVETIEVHNEEIEKELDEAKNRESELLKEIDVLNKKLSISSPEAMKFKVKFENWQSYSHELIELAKQSENSEKYINAIKTIVKGWAL